MSTALSVLLVGFGFIGILGLAIIRKGDVKAAMKLLGIEFSLDTKDRKSDPKH